MKRERNAKNAGGTANSQLKVVSTFLLPNHRDNAAKPTYQTPHHILTRST